VQSAIALARTRSPHSTALHDGPLEPAAQSSRGPIGGIWIYSITIGAFWPKFFTC
jgi:hypothetical protein